MFKFFRRKRFYGEIFPDEIFLDSRNSPQFDTDQFEGRLIKPLSAYAGIYIMTAFLIISLLYGGRLFFLQVVEGKTWAKRSLENTLRHALIFPERGVVYDRFGIPLAYNQSESEYLEFSDRVYAAIPGLAHLLGYVSYPGKDKAGFYYQVTMEGKDGVERSYNQTLSGLPGTKLIEVDAFGKVHSESIIDYPKSGAALTLSIDAKLQSALYEGIKNLSERVSFRGGAGVIFDVNSGELLALTSFPEYDPSVLSKGDEKDIIASYRTNEALPFLNRAVSGLYTPGSIVKPFLAMAALSEKIISPDKEILSTGSISVENPYDKSKKSVFMDWKAHGYVDMRQALAVSSNVYFYEIGGGYEGQKGLGIYAIADYMRRFGFGAPISGMFSGGPAGTVPTPEWKEENFPGEPWRLGDTYNTSIGQYGFQVTPLQVARAVALIANGGKLFSPRVIYVDGVTKEMAVVALSSEDLKVVREGMRQSVLLGTAKALSFPAITIAAKTGTAELGSTKKFVNSWVMGFFPYETPRFAFAVIMEHGSRENLYGAPLVMREVMEWIYKNRPEYLSITPVALQ